MRLLLILNPSSLVFPMTMTISCTNNHILMKINPISFLVKEHPVTDTLPHRFLLPPSNCKESTLSPLPAKYLENFKFSKYYNLNVFLFIKILFISCNSLYTQKLVLLSFQQINKKNIERFQNENFLHQRTGYAPKTACKEKKSSSDLI